MLHAVKHLWHISEQQKPLGDASRLALAAPGTFKAQTLAAGHFAPLTAKDQINAMILDFIVAANRIRSTEEVREQ